MKPPVAVEDGATTYSYHHDDLTQTITDARTAAATTFGYNQRHLPTAITYGVPGGVAQTPAVAMDYDSAGNREWMDDGPGYVDYVYNTLSQLESETRYFDDLPGRSYRIGYEYNLGGQVKSITDPFGSRVEYGRDRMGRVTGVTGTGYADLGTPVSQLATNVKYRAWGALKELTNGDAPARSMFRLGYDSRLQLRRFEAGGKVTEHDYHADGLVGYVRDLSYANFNRTYVYDHAGRLKEARAGESAPYTNPYSYTYEYDVWGNTTARLGTHWNQSADYTTTYANNRNQKLEYDAAGNAVRNLEIFTADTKTYDAAGRLAVSRELDAQGTSYSRSTTTYDGDGRQVRFHYQHESTGGYAALYYVRSTALGGQTVAQLWTNNNFPQPNRDRAYVYLNGEVLAYHDYGHPYDPEAERTVWWAYRNPVTGTNLEQSIASTEPPVEQAIDPLGAEVGVSAPPPPAPEPGGPGSGVTLGNVSDFGTGCYLDGIETPCSTALGLVNSGAADVTSIYAPGGVGGQVGGYTLIPDYTDTSRDRWDSTTSTVYGGVGYRVMFAGASNFMGSGGGGGRGESVEVTGG